LGIQEKRKKMILNSSLDLKSIYSKDVIYEFKF